MTDEERQTIQRIVEAHAQASSAEELESVLADIRTARCASSPTARFVRVLQQLEAFSLTDLGRAEDAFSKLLQWFESETSGWRLSVALDAACLLHRVEEPPHTALAAVWQMFQTEGLDPLGKAALLRELLLCVDVKDASGFDDWEGGVRRFVLELGLDHGLRHDVSVALSAFFSDQGYVARAQLSGGEVDVSRLNVPWWRAKFEDEVPVA